MKQYAKQKAEEKKAAMNAIGRDSSEFQEPDVDIRDPKFEKQHLGFPLSYGDEDRFAFWKAKAVNLNKILEDQIDQSRLSTKTNHTTFQK